MNTKIQSTTAYILLAMMTLQSFPSMGYAGNDELVYPLKEISKLECRFEEFSSLGSDCKQSLPVLKTKDYEKYASKDGGYNDFTRIYTVLWGSSYKYGWDVGSGGHPGTDFATAKGTPVYSIADGKVLQAANEPGWGNYVSIEHTIRDKKVISNYAHLSKLDVEKGESIKAGEKIGEVGSTGNSTGNHLHFQIDLPGKFHPYFYEYSICPYSYNEISEKGLCFDQLEANTLDPIAFLESNGAILEEVRQTQKSSSTKNTSTTSTSKASETKISADDIFSTYLYLDTGSSEQVKQMQRIFNKLGYYEGSISGDYEDILEDIIHYQLTTGVISSRDVDGAGYFGPKTRAQAQKDYNSYVASGGQSIVTVSVSTKTETPKNKVTPTQKVSREKLLTREEIEAREVQDFLKGYEINFKNPISQISEKDTKVTTIQVLDGKGRGFKGNVPGNVSFDYDESKVSVFPKSFFNFIDGEREISITGKSAGHTTISVKIGEVIVKTFSVTVGKVGDAPKVESAKIYGTTNVVLAEKNTAIVLLKDQYGNKMMRSPYAGSYQISAGSDILYCIKRGSIEDIVAVYKRPCLDAEFSPNLSFDYDDTIGGLLVFDYKVLKKTNTSLQLKALESKKELTQVTLQVQAPKDLSSKNPYYSEIIAGLESGAVSGIKQGYFLEDRELTQADALTWIDSMFSTDSQVQEKIQELQKDAKQQSKELTRGAFLTLLSQVLDTQTTQTTKDYRDLDSTQETLLAGIAGAQYSWRDEFSENYFQPKKVITRGEAVYFLTQTLKQQGSSFLVRK